ncbi:GAF domain-containing sensor histidine kinase [Candidatus Sumerlaeota bacterium]|nr:GAF domain-containing sensor histidine kinase [Candidatus Sumerlaeota bacterium]
MDTARKTHKQESGEIAILFGLMEKINQGLVLEDVLNHIFDSFKPIIPYNRISLCLIEKEGTVVRACWFRTESSQPQITRGFEFPLAKSSLKYVAESGRPRVINDLEDYLINHPDSDCTKKILEEGILSNLVCPLMIKEKAIGFLFFSSFKKNTYQESHIELLYRFAGHLALIVEKSRLYQELVEINEIKNKILGIVAHDLRNPITIISSYARIMSRGMLGWINEEQKEALEKIQETCNNMTALVNDLIDISVIESGRLDLKPDEIDLEEFLKECHSSNYILALEKKIVLKLEHDPELPRVFWDSNRIKQVINNLVTNAIKFSHPETEITIRACVKGDDVEISVLDQGQGIPEDEMVQIFTDYGRTSVKPTAGEKSTGLGLAISKRNVEAHGGGIRVESRINHGSTFSFWLPIKNADLRFIRERL